MASSVIERPGPRSESHQRDHLQSFIASKQAYLDAKAAQQRAEYAAEICKAAPSQKPIPVGEVCALNDPSEIFAFAGDRTMKCIAFILKCFGCKSGKNSICRSVSSVSLFQSINQLLFQFFQLPNSSQDLSSLYVRVM